MKNAKDIEVQLFQFEKIQPIEPKIIKKQEEASINYAYTNLTQAFNDFASKFTPVEGVRYLWVYTEKKEIIIGIEEPWNYPQAFIDTKKLKDCQFFHEKIKPLKLNNKLGHPTLTIIFDEKNGTIQDSQTQVGKALIGGELIFVDKKWKLDNNSGRFGNRKKDPTTVQNLMHEILAQFKNITTINPIFQISLSHARYLNAYYKIWEKSNDEVQSAINLLEDYTKSNMFNLFFSGHWGRKNVDLVKKALLEFKKNRPNTLEDIFIFFSKRIDTTKINLNGSLMRRLNFISGQTNNKLNVTEVQPRPQ